MNKILLLLVCFLTLGNQFANSQNTKPDFKKNSIQLGKTGYYFDRENPFGIGERGFKLKVFWYDDILVYLPYIGYTRKFSPAFGMRVSIENYSDCYSCKKYPVNVYPPAFEVMSRNFRHLQFNFLYDYSVTKRLSLLLAAGSGYRWAPYGELWYVDPWTDSLEGGGRYFDEWGLGGAFEVKYKFYKQFSLSAKGEYFSFPVRPMQHWGAGAYLGFDF